MELVDLIETRRFLGGEFMMWIWYKSECFDSLLELEGHGGVEVWIDDRLTLEAYLAETERNSLKGGAPAHSPEAKTALRQGKRVSRAKLGIIKEGREWSMTLKTEGMDISSAKLPALLSREDEEQFYERMYLLEELEDILATLYQEFLAIRLSPAWSEVMVPAIRDWIYAEDVLDRHHYPAAELYERLGLTPHSALGIAIEDEDEDDEDDLDDELEVEAAEGPAEEPLERAAPSEGLEEGAMNAPAEAEVQ